MLKQVAQRLLSCVRETDTVARVGGDEFLIIAIEINSPDNAIQIAKEVIELVSQPVIFKERLADKAMYKVKNAGKNGFHFVNTSIK